MERKKLRWWQDTIVYEAYPNSFSDTDGDGFGDLQGLISRLDYLESLGVGAIWLTPVYASPMGDNGYDVSDYYAINPRYGTMEDMDLLIKEAGKHGIKIVMDLVFNHTSNECQWFIESENDPHGEKGDWYIWKDPVDGKEPNNWGAFFGDSVWTYSKKRGQYYLHSFASFQPDLNWENPKVRKALFDVANFWVDKGVGGFRLDAVTYIKKPKDFSDGPVDKNTGFALIHNMTANREGILDFLSEFKEKVQKGHDIFTVGEANGVSAKELPLWVGNKGVFDMIFEFSHVNIQYGDGEIWCRARDWKLTELKKAIENSQASTAKEGWYPIFFENHDQPRSVDHFFPKEACKDLTAKLIGMLNLTLRGTPFIYEGQELGMTNIEMEKIEDYDDIFTKDQYKVAVENGYTDKEALNLVQKYSRDNARTPMQWDDTKNAGFSEGIPWLFVNRNYTKINAKAEDKDPYSVLNWYRKLSKMRKEFDVFITGDFSLIFPESEEIFAYKREIKGSLATVLINFTGKDVSYDPAFLEGAKLLLSNYEGKDEKMQEMKGILRPYEAVCFLS